MEERTEPTLESALAASDRRWALEQQDPDLLRARLRRELLRRPLVRFAASLALLASGVVVPPVLFAWSGSVAVGAELAWWGAVVGMLLGVTALHGYWLLARYPDYRRQWRLAVQG